LKRALRLQVKLTGERWGKRNSRTALDPVDTCCLCGAARLLGACLLVFCSRVVGGERIVS
jgi:hypothetical protein